MRTLLPHLLISLGILALPAKADPTSGQHRVRCTTTQSFVWPTPDPNGATIEKSVQVSNEVSDLDPALARFYAGQSVWKECRRELEQFFDHHWQQFGLSGAPRSLDDLGRLRPKPQEICLQFITNPEKYSCEEVTSDVGSDRN